MDIPINTLQLLTTPCRTLTPREIEVLHLRFSYTSGVTIRSYREIAEQLNLSKSYIRVVVNNAIAKLRDAWGEAHNVIWDDEEEEWFDYDYQSFDNSVNFSEQDYDD